MNEILDLAQQMGLVLGAAFYVSIVIWTYKDARKRTEDPIMVATFTAIAMLPLFGVFIYMLVRPAEYLADVRERELEIRALERQLGRQERCPYCKSHIEGDYLSCPVCTTKLRQQCTGCDKPLDPRWVMCPFCETEVPGRGGRGPSGPGGGSRRQPVNTSSSRPRGESTSSSSRESTRPRKERTERKERKDRKDGDRDRSGSSKDAAPVGATSTSSTDADKDGGDIRTEPFGS